jgi:hypothetical protein
MTPRLLLITGPCAYTVGDVVQEQKFEVRDFLGTCKLLRLDLDRHPRSSVDFTAQELADAICVQPQGIEWLVGLVLPTPYPYVNLTCGHSCVGRSLQWDCPVCRKYYALPDRLAILAPNLYDEYEDYTDESGRARIRKVPLLVEWVRAWGGEEWHCGTCAGTPLESHPRPCAISICFPSSPGRQARGATWPEAVQAALGEEMGEKGPLT